MKVRIEQLTNNMCGDSDPRLECVYFTKRGAVSSDGIALLVVPYSEAEGFEEGDEIIAVNFKECERVAKFFKKHLLQDELIDLKVSDDNKDLIFQSGSLFPSATIKIARTLGVKMPNFDAILDEPRPHSNFMFQSSILMDAIKAVCDSSKCKTVRIRIEGVSSKVFIEPVNREHPENISFSVVATCY